MARLYVIGNGFDCKVHIDKYGRYMKTAYTDFRDYLKYKYPKHNIDGSVPEEGILYGGDYGYDFDDIIGFIIKTLDNVDSEWNSIEDALGSSVFDEFSFMFQEYKFDDMSDKDEYQTRLNNEDIANNIRSAFVCIMQLFKEWVTTEVASIDFKNFDRRSDIDNVFSTCKDSYFLNFNYSFTLENLYAIDPERILHIHGKADASSDEIIFGHGSEEPYFGDVFPPNLAIMDDLKEELKKDIQLNKIDVWLNSLKDVTDIFSYGFSFSNVDMKYVKTIKDHFDLSSITWYLNKYDSEHNPQFKTMLEKEGFTVKEEIQW